MTTELVDQFSPSSHDSDQQPEANQPGLMWTKKTGSTPEAPKAGFSLRELIIDEVRSSRVTVDSTHD